MDSGPFNVLFLCTGNWARSILAEAILKSLGRDRFNAFSAGSHPTGRVNPFALELLERNRLPTEALRSKAWGEFAEPGAPVMHFVFTVCDQAAAETCPVWPGQPMTAHWGVSDPAAVEGADDEKRHAFLKAYTELYRRISLFIACLSTSSKSSRCKRNSTRSAGRMILGRSRRRGGWDSTAARNRRRFRHHGRAAGARQSAVALLANSIATGAGLYVLIVVFGPISGAHFNPVVSAVAV